MRTDPGPPGDVHWDHPQTEVAYGHGVISVDTGCVGLLTRLWAEGYETIGCCEEAYEGHARLWFRSTQQARRFIEQHPGAYEGYLPHTADFPVEYLADRKE